MLSRALPTADGCYTSPMWLGVSVALAWGPLGEPYHPAFRVLRKRQWTLPQFSSLCN